MKPNLQIMLFKQLGDSLVERVFKPAGWTHRGRATQRVFWKTRGDATVSVRLRAHVGLQPDTLTLSVLSCCVVHALDLLLDAEGFVAESLPVPPSSQRPKVPEYVNLADIWSDRLHFGGVKKFRPDQELQLHDERDRDELDMLLGRELMEVVFPVLDSWMTIRGVVKYARRCSAVAGFPGSSGHLLAKLGALGGDEALFDEGVTEFRGSWLVRESASGRQDPLEPGHPRRAELVRLVLYCRRLHDAPTLFEETMRAHGVQADSPSELAHSWAPPLWFPPGLVDGPRTESSSSGRPRDSGPKPVSATTAEECPVTPPDRTIDLGTFEPGGLASGCFLLVNRTGAPVTGVRIVSENRSVRFWGGAEHSTPISSRRESQKHEFIVAQDEPLTVCVSVRASKSPGRKIFSIIILFQDGAAVAANIAYEVTKPPRR